MGSHPGVLETATAEEASPSVLTTRRMGMAMTRSLRYGFYRQLLGFRCIASLCIEFALHRIAWGVRRTRLSPALLRMMNKPSIEGHQ